MISHGVVAIEIEKEATGFAFVVLVGAIIIGDLLSTTVGSSND